MAVAPPPRTGCRRRRPAGPLAVVMWADHLGNPTNYGEGTYAGAGGYAGLTYHELIAGGDQYASISGWIEPATN